MQTIEAREIQDGMELIVKYKDTGEVKSLTLDIHKIVKLVRLA